MSAPAEGTQSAIGQLSFGPPEVLEAVTIPIPTPGPRDLLIRVKAVAFNPVDEKIRGNPDKKALQGPFPVITGYDVAGIVEALGSSTVAGFKVGDAVFFAGSSARKGGLSQYVAVDERIVALKPKSLSFVEAAALPLTSITAYEGLFERAGVTPLDGSEGKTALVVGGAGGAGSIGIQLLKKIAGYTVVATASRPETVEFAKAQGADFVINHREPLKAQLEALGISSVSVIYNTANPNENFEELISLLGPEGKIVSILPLTKPTNLLPVFLVAGTIVFELMFVRPWTGVSLEKQGQLLSRISKWVDAGTLKTTLTKTYPFTAEGAIAAHKELESGRAIGKSGTVVEE